MKLIILTIAVIALLILSLSCAYMAYMEFKKEPKQTQHKMDLYTQQSLKLMLDIAKSYAKPAIITAARNQHLTTGLIKHGYAVRGIVRLLTEANFHPNQRAILAIGKIVEDVWQSNKDDIKKAGLDSRTNTPIPPADQLDSDKLKKEITDPTINK